MSRVRSRSVHIPLPGRDGGPAAPSGGRPGDRASDLTAAVRGWLLLRAGGACLAAACVLAQPGCTVFDGVVPPAGGAGGEGGAGAGGTGGEPYLSEAEAITVCAQARTCAGLADAIRLSTGVPVSASSFSACLTWLAGPIAAAGRTGFAAQQSLLRDIAGAAGCEEMLARTILRPAPTPCTPGCSADGDTLDDCTRGVRINCRSGFFDDGVTPAACTVHEGAARCHSSACCISVTNKDCRKPEDLAICTSGSSDVCWDTLGGDSGFHVVTRCADLGISCTGVSGYLQEDIVLPCAPPSDDCAGDVPSCAGSGTVRSCVAGIPSLFECAPLGRACTPVDGGVACAREGGCSLSSTSCVDPSQIDVCVGGVTRRMSCGAGRSCVPAGGGLSAGCE